MYEEHFGLTAKPFQLSPDAAFFFPSKEHKRALSFLEYGLDQGDGFIVITGDVGTGKTTIVQTLLSELDPNALMVANIVTTQLEEGDLMHLVAANFGLKVNTNSKALLLRDLERLFVQQAKENRRVLLIVDEAQNLPARSVEELRMLSNFQRDGKPLVQIFLLGQAEFRNTLLSEEFEQLRQRVIATYHLNPLEESETRTYIEHRLSCAGWTGRPEFTDEAFRAIYAASEGVPRRINNLCDRILLFAFLEERESIDIEVVDSVSRELGGEFWSGRPEPKASLERVEEVFNTPGQPLEAVARVMFDKANVQQRLGSLERAVDALGSSLKSDVSELKEEIGYLNVLLEEVLSELRESGSSGKKRA
ncbi:MAG: XrtA-associated ATPase [Pseudomonadales bacterium]|nr:XrtA-associated ATPase [Pseudomonadales bacterium]